jgi:hypothetical protein
MIAFVFQLLLLCGSAEGRIRAAVMLQARRHVLEAQGNPNRLGPVVNKVYNRAGKEPVHYQIKSKASDEPRTAQQHPLGEFTVIRDDQVIGTIRTYSDVTDHWAPVEVRSSWPRVLV